MLRRESETIVDESEDSSSNNDDSYDTMGFPPSGYDYSQSTEDNYSVPEPSYVGCFAEQRLKLDYGYHKHYNPQRQLLQDHLCKQFLRTRIVDGDMVCSTPTQPWIVFTAGPMGAGKSHTMMWMKKRGYFPLEGFVHVDPDKLRAMLPETEEYLSLNRETAGFLTQKETGYCSEMLTMHALSLGKNVVVDGSLRNAEWYSLYFQRLRSEFPDLRIAILHIFASAQTVCTRARERTKITGRYVPESILLSTIEQIPHSLKILTPQADLVAEIQNEDEPTLVNPHMTWEQFRNVWQQECRISF